jgi:dTDP-glucose pyrophosphorylase
MISKEKIQQRSIGPDLTLIKALKFMDMTGFKSLLVLEKDYFFAGVLSIGDIQRAIIKDISLDTIVSNVLREKPRIAFVDTPLVKIKEEMLLYRMEFVPIIDKTNQVIDIYLWDELFLKQKLPPKKRFNLPIVIMAGGFGSRLKPLTCVLPKPLIPYGGETIIEEILRRFEEYGCDRYFISINYKSDLIEFYLKNQNLKYQIEFLKEKKPMGTAGSLSLLKGRIDKTFFVSNCDILIEQDYSEILDYHYSNKNEITIVAALKHYPIAYGTIETGVNGRLLKLIEKPEITFKINSGMYILEPHILKEVPINQHFHITNLIEQILERKGKVGVFPVSEKSWKDMGSWAELKKHFKELG